MPEAYQVHQGPNYLGFAAQMTDAMPDVIGAQSKAVDVAGHIQSIRSMAQQLAHDQEMFPLKLADAEMANKLLQNRVREEEVTKAPERLKAAADLKMQEDSLKIKSMQETFNQRAGMDQFNEKYAPDLMKAMVNGNMDDFTSIWATASSDPNAKYMLPQMMEMKKSLTEQKTADFEAKLIQHQQDVMAQRTDIQKRLMSLKNEAEAVMRPDITPEQKLTGGLKIDDLAMGGKSGPISDRQKAMAETALSTWAAKRLEEAGPIWKAKNGPAAAMLEYLAANPSVDVSMIGALGMGLTTGVEVAGQMLLHPQELATDPIAFGGRLKGKEYGLYTYSDAKHFRLQYFDAMKMMDSADEKVAATGRAHMTELLGMFQDPTLMAREVKQHKLESLAKQYNDVLETMPEGEAGTYVPQGIRYVPNRVSTARANQGSTTVTERTDATGQKVRTVATRTLTGATSLGGGVMVKVIAPDGSSGSIPQSQVDAALASGATLAQ